MRNPLAALRDSAAFHFTTLLGFALFLNREGTLVPGGNENVYLLYLLKAWRPGFLASDWTFQEPTAGHPVFNFLFGWPTRFLSLETVGWIGRLGSWAFLFAALLRIGRHFRIPPWAVWAGVLLWLVQRQSFVSNEWVIGTFEAKCAAYACLLWAIDAILRGRLILPAVLTGLAFSFHSAVGLWGGAAVGIAFASQRPVKQTLQFAAWSAGLALPGVVTALRLFSGGHAITPTEARFLVTVEMPFHLDPLTFGAGKIAVLYAMLLFNVAHVRANRGDGKLRFLIGFELSAGAFFLLGIMFRLAGKFTLVELFPFRVFAVTVMLFFFWHLAAAFYQRREKPLPAAAVALGVFTFFCLPSPVMRLQGLAASQLPKWRHHPDDFLAAAKWVRENTPPDTVVIAPPWRKDTFYYVQRPLVADWHAPRYDAMTEWRERIESLVGDVSRMDPQDNLAGEMDQRARDHYASLDDAALTSLAHQYHATILITPAQHAYPALFNSGDYHVYRLPQ